MVIKAIYYRFEYYQKQAVEAYKQHLQTYFQIVKASLKKFGYKEHRGDQYDYERLKWLVYWNTNICSKEELLQEIMNTTNPDIDPSTINKAFSKFFQDYDLPVRGILKGNDST